MLFASCEVHIGKNCASGLEYVRSQDHEGRVFPNTDRHRLASNVAIFSFYFFFSKNKLRKRIICLFFMR